ncbi:MAG: recombinase family protein [Lachnospiraceae bacterium]|nr:recombinase family protein [Lachnospiraceae bacterium]
MDRIYGYVRISTPKQKIERQIDNIRLQYPDAVIIAETYTGTSLDRPRWNKLVEQIKRDIEKGLRVLLIFDEVSRMSRNAREGFETYKFLYDLGVDLEFLKEPHINTSCYREAVNSKISMTGGDIDIILQAVNAYMMILAERQIEIAFQTAQAEVDFLHKRTSEGVRKAQASGKQVGRKIGQKIITKKSIKAKNILQIHCRDFGGSLSDKETMILAGISRNTFYKYKAELKADMINHNNYY